MAARGLLTPFHVRTKPSALRLPVVIPNFMPWLGKSSCSSHVRFFCNHRISEIDKPKYREKFAHKMAMAGIKPHHRLAIAVSGGPDSIALCVLTAAWKSDNFDAGKERKKSVDGLLAIVVDHGLRSESAEEANLVYNRVLDMGIKCTVARCEWLDGRPQPGHLQEAARSKRYETLQNICIQQKISILLIAHHADDQAELFILRLSRNSGVLGLAGMAFISQAFPEFPDFSGGGSKTHGILLVRPLLEFSKEDMYNICLGGNQQWVEDPTNRSSLYARNRIRMSLNNMLSPIFKDELQSAILACRRTRVHVDKLCHLLLNHAVTIMPHGYAVIDLGNLHSVEVRKNIYLARFGALLLQFISQRHRPVRGNALKLLLGYLRSFPCKTSLNVAGCYLCPAPGSKGTKVLVCYSVDSSFPLTMKLCGGQSSTSEVEQIVKDSEASVDVHVPDSFNVPFLDVTSSEYILNEARGLEILSDSTYMTILSLQKEECDNFRSKVDIVLSNDNKRSSEASPGKPRIYPGQVGYFMNRFVLDWKVCSTMGVEGQCFCSYCVIGDEMVAEVRHMVDADWIYLSDLSKETNLGDSQVVGKTTDYAILSASRALGLLKSIPVAVRRAMPVLVNCKGVLLSIPSIGFSHCPHLVASAVFSPRIPLGGGHSSFL
ncbi:hypothetical protein CASFOL_034366 [Castilleja foliolosa]|uniref:tRNA(Ile)-lysidine synthetase n=1 Tax=Castilleja foliolosa TaxID=1961234 RepID=A0ABD3BX74_9LAMI